MTKKAEKNLTVIPNVRIEKRIFWLRGQKVMLDADLAELYDVEVKALNQAVKRNIERFPKDFMFQLTFEEAQMVLFSRSQNVTLKRGKNIKYAPYAFTEMGVAMLSSVLKSKRAIAVNIQIMRTFVQLRNMLVTHEALRRKIETMEQKYDKRFKVVFDVLRRLLKEEPEPKKKIGFAERRK
ncbi:MAG: ORF6N domain-containing protein [Candidatus Moranbacteria bacterium]|nr:ORF6N domain-containing protein [Candidatus Moranbacteria bacterium]